MYHDYNTRTKKESVVSCECLQTVESDINNINSLKDEIISLKETVIKRLQEENERLRDKCKQVENRVDFIESSHDALEQYGRRNNLVISGIPDSVQNSDLELTVASVLSDIDINVELKEVEDCHRIGKSNNGSKKTIIRFINRKYCKKALLKRKQLERIDLKKHKFLSGTRIFINENLKVKNEHLAFNCRQLKKRNYIFGIFTKNGTVYIKENENSRPVVILNMDALHDKFPNFYDLRKEGNDNRDISGDQNASVLSSC